MPVDHFIKFKTGWILPYDGIQSVIPAYSVKYLKCLFFKNLCYIPKVNFSVVFFSLSSSFVMYISFLV